MSVEILLQGARDGNIDSVNSSLDNSVDINSKDDGGCTALIVAANKDHRAVCILLVDKGAEVNDYDNDGNTALIVSTREGHLLLCQLLIDNGAELDIE
jgi:ankyrin repeat protein